MIKKIVLLLTLMLGLTLIAGCQEETPTTITLPDLTGMTKTEALNALSRLNIVVTFDDIIDNNKTEGVFHSYETGFAAGDVVEPGTEITVNFVIHEVINGVVLPDITGLTQAEINTLFLDLDVNYTFTNFPTKDVEEGYFAGYAGNYQIGMVVDFWTNITIRIATPVIASELIITTYVEGVGTNKAIEIMNRSDEAIDLSDYRISIYTNGATEPNINIALDGELQPNGIYVIANSSSEAGLLEKADLITADLTFDGNDPVAITFKNGQVIDVIGTIGFQIFHLENETFVRKSNITEGTSLYNIMDWDIYAVDNYTMLGTHPTPYPLLTLIRFEPSQVNIPFAQPGGMVQVTYDYANDGDTSTFYSLDPEVPHFLGGDRVRFVGINTPEMTPTPQPWAVEAMQYLRSILENAEVIYVMHDPETGITDTYDRKLGLVWADGLLVNLEMVRMGYSASTYNDPEQRLVFNGISLNRLFERAEQEARANRRGIWS